MTLWLVTILSVLAVAIGRYLSLGVKMAGYRLAREQAVTLARGGVYLAMQRLADDPPEAEGQAYDWEGDEWAAKIPGATLEVIPHAGHLSNLDAPDVFDRAIRDLVRRVARARAGSD